MQVGTTLKKGHIEIVIDNVEFDNQGLVYITYSQYDHKRGTGENDNFLPMQLFLNEIKGYQIINKIKQTA